MRRVWNYYNENDPFAIEWLRELIRQKHIPAGEVDSRSILEVQPDDLRGFRQHHFFAGIGGWSLALRIAEWPEGKPIWTGSCPCQPFSQAGKGRGEADERHLWPHFRFLVAKRNPSEVIGEQVDSPLGRLWLAGIRADLEALRFEVGASGLCAAAVAAPHGRPRLYWVAQSRSQRARRGIQRSCEGPSQDGSGASGQLGGSSGASGMVESDSNRRTPRESSAKINGHGLPAGSDGCTSWLGDPNQQGRQGFEFGGNGASERFVGPSSLGNWREFSIVRCGDGKTRRVEPGTFPLAHGFPARMDLLRGFGNAIVPQLAAEFIKAYLEAKELK